MIKQKCAFFRQSSVSCFARAAWLGVLFTLTVPYSLFAQDHTVTFSTTDPGVTRSIANWGLDTCWPSYDNMQRGLLYMSTNKVNVVRVGFFVDSQLANNDVSNGDKSNMQTMANYAGMATAATRWDMNLASSVNSWYISGANRVYPDRWAAAISACQRYYNRSIYMVEGFNEPDYTPNNEGSSGDLNNILAYLSTSNNFAGTLMAGGSTLNNDVAVSWFNPVASHASIGTTHCLAGNVWNYWNFMQTVIASNAAPWNPELHNVGEAIIGAQYGLQGGIWWGPAELARGEFVKACQGKQLGYADDWTDWTAAAVYRGTNGAVQAFVGESERQGLVTTYRFFSKDRDVFYNGHGPQRAYEVTTTGGATYGDTNQHHNAELVVNVNWGSDVQPVVDGTYIVVNRGSGRVLEVPSGDTTPKTQLDQYAYQGQPYQQWTIHPLSNTSGGDYSYYTMTAGHDGMSANDLYNSYDESAAIGQWTNSADWNSQWYLEYAGDGYFKIRNRWSTKVMAPLSTAPRASIVQQGETGSTLEEWRLIPTNRVSFFSTADTTAPAAPTNVIASANAVSVNLTWNTNSESDFASYTVLRSATNGGSYDIIARGLTTTNFTDKSANQTNTYYYVVRAVDIYLNTSTNSLQASAAPTLVPALIAKYAFDGSAADSSGNANDASLTGSPVYTSGADGQALSLNGANQYAMAPAGLMASATNFTFGAWVWWNGGAAWQRIMDFGNDTSHYLFLTPSSTNNISPGTNSLRFAIKNGGSEQSVETSKLPIGQWVHVAVTYGGGIAKLYTNGVLVASNSVSISPADFNPALNYLGRSQFTESNGDPLFNGRLDDVVLYNYALSASEISALLVNSDGTTNAQSLLHYYYSASGTTITNDQVGSANGTLYGSAALSGGAGGAALRTYGVAAGLSGGALTNGMQLPGVTTAGLTNAFTIENWFQTVSGNAGRQMFCFSDGTTGTLLIGLPSDPYSGGYPLQYAGHAYAQQSGGGFTDVYDVNSPGTTYLDDNILHQMVLTYDGYSLTMYVDGKVQQSAAIAGLNLSTMTKVCVSGGSPWTPNDPNMDGYTYAFGFFSGALSSNQVTALYGLGRDATASAISSSVLVPAAPANLSALPGDAVATLTWDSVAGATSYNVKRSTNNVGPYLTVTNVTAANDTDTGLSNGTNYFYVVSTINAGGESTNSLPVAVRPVSLAPFSASISLSGGSINLLWPPNHTGWRLQAQTNDLSAGLGSNWVDVAGSTNVNQMSIPMNPTNGSVFYRLVYP